MDARTLWDRYQRHLCLCEPLGIQLDVSRMAFADDFLERMAPAMARAFQAMAALEKGAIANPDEQRQVGHYWLRTPDLAPEPGLTAEIKATLARLKQVAAAVHQGKVKPQQGGRFTRAL